MRHPIRSNASRLAAAALVFFAAACGDDPLGPQWPEDVNFAASLGIDLEAMTMLDSGVYYRIDTAGVDVPIMEGEVTVDYTLWLPNGTEVESGSFPFTFGTGMVIPGFEQGVSGMRLNEIRTIVVPSELAYGAAGTSSIPPHSVLVFRVELTDWSGPV